MAEIDLALIARQQERILPELRDAREERGAMRDDMAVMLAMMQRFDASLHGLVHELRALARQQGRHTQELRGHEGRLKAVEDRLGEPQPS